MGRDLADRALGGGIEQAQRFQFVAEEIEPQALFEAGGVDIEQRAAHRIFAGIDDGVGPRIALPLEQGDQALPPDLDAGTQFAHRLADAERGEHALEERVDRRDQQLRLAGAQLEPVKRRQPPRADREGGARPVIGQAVPRRELDDVQLRREEGRGFGNGAHRAFVRCDEHGPATRASAPRRPCQVGKDQRLRPARDSGEGQRGGGGKDAGNVGHGEGSEQQRRGAERQFPGHRGMST